MLIGKCPGDDEEPARAGDGGGHRRDVQLRRPGQGWKNLMEVSVDISSQDAIRVLFMCNLVS